ncbi:hypothetical protein VKT23_017077 [Stygiomarasmius scandens]|uniref:Transposase n=1 Tax=Marasmiellus scandens TaxID=2682957 RepID=A0ABR1IVM3_9AGAR
MNAPGMTSATFQGLTTMREAYVSKIVDILSIRMIEGYEAACQAGEEMEYAQSICQKLAPVLEEINDEEDIDEIVLEALEQASQALDEPFDSNDGNWEDVEDQDMKSNHSDLPNTLPSVEHGHDDSTPPEDILCTWDARRVVKVLEPELFARIQAEITSVSGNVEIFNETGRRLREVLGTEKMDHYKEVAKRWNREGPGRSLMHHPYVCRKYKRSRRSYLHSSWRQFRVHQIILSYYVGADSEPHFSLMEGPSSVTMGKSAPNVKKRIQDLFSKWVQEHIGPDGVSESTRPGPEWIHPRYPNEDKSGYPLLCKRDAKGGHQDLKRGLRFYMNAVAEYYGWAVMPWGHLRDKDLELFTKDTFIKGLTLGDPSSLTMPTNKVWWDTMYERQEIEGKRPVQFRIRGDIKTSRPTAAIRKEAGKQCDSGGTVITKDKTLGNVQFASSSSSVRSRHFEEDIDERQSDAQIRPLILSSHGQLHAKVSEINSISNYEVTNRDYKKSPRIYVEVSDTPGPESPRAIFEASDEEDVRMGESGKGGRNPSTAVLDADSEEQANANDAVPVQTNEKIVPTKRRSGKKQKQSSSKKARVASPVLSDDNAQDTALTEPHIRRSNRAPIPSRRHDTSSTVSTSPLSPGILKWSIESLQPLLLECGLAQHIYNGMPDRPDWKRCLTKWLRAEQHLPYTEGCEIPRLLPNLPDFMKLWVEFKAVPINRYQEYFVPEGTLKSPTTIREAETWIRSLDLKTAAARVDMGRQNEAPWLRRAGEGLAQVFFAFSVWGRALKLQPKSSVQSLTTFRTEFARLDTICDSWSSATS